MDFAGALPIFVITLREGVEAALVVGIVLAALTKSQKNELIPWVYWGILAGVGGSVLIGQLLSWGLRRAGQVNPQLEPVLEPFLKSGLCVVAIAMLSWMLIWMTQQSKSLKGEIENALTSSLQTSAAGWGVFTLVGIAVLREGFETVLFIFANAQQSSAALGAVAGLTGAVGIGFALFKWGIKIDLRRFFQVMGILLLLIVAGLVVSALKNIDAAIYALSSLQFAGMLCFSTDSCVLGPLAWDTSTVLPDRQFPGVVFKALLGYRDHLYWLQVIGYSLFLSTVGTLYFRSLGGPVTKPLSSRQSAS
jgi:high-affinity iron transporter